MKSCKYCGGLNHTATFCFARPRKTLVDKKKIRSLGKHGQKWLKVREQWLIENPEPWYCYLCGQQLFRSTITLDHIIPRSRRPDLRYDFSNLRPACYKCNYEKGSKVL